MMEVKTMQRVELRKLAASSQQYADQQLTVAGWVRTIRTSKSLGFIELNDGTCFQNLQVVFEEGKVNNFNEVGKLNVGASIIVTGTLILTPEAKQPYEIHAATIEVEGNSTPDYPLQKKRHSHGVSCAPSPICAPGPTPSARCSGCVPRRLSPSTNSLMSAALSTSTPR